MAESIVMTWQATSFHGWGVYALNLALAWAADSEIAITATRAVTANLVSIDPLRWRALQPFRARSAGLEQFLSKQPKQPITLNAPLLVGLGDRLASEPGPHGSALLGRPSVGVVFFETDDLGRDAAKKAEHHACIVAGSQWNAEVLRAHGVPRVETVVQGIDPALFHPAPKTNLFPGRFLVFSGGKLEMRKGQDKVLAAWRIFSARHPDAMLVTAWYSPWPHLAQGINASECAAPLPFTQDGNPDIEGWAVANGIKPDQFLNLGAVPNASMPPILREMDAAIFPNRCEGGTNLVAMEAMACGVPTILSANSGHLDLLQDGAALPLTDQRPIQTASGWHESNLDEMVAALEKLYEDRTCASVLGAAGAEQLSRMTWSKTSAQMKSIIKTL